MSSLASSNLLSSSSSSWSWSSSSSSSSSSSMMKVLRNSDSKIPREAGDSSQKKRKKEASEPSQKKGKKEACDSSQKKGKKEASEPSQKKGKKEAGEYSESFCEICMERKPAEEMFSNKKICRHSYCRECIGKHVASKVQENVNPVKCPDLNCKAVLEPYHFRSVVSDRVLDRWSRSICDSVIIGSRRFYCPFKDCSGVMLVDDEGEGRAIVRESECPYCHRLFCAKCKVPWHSGIGCEEFKRLDKNDTRREDLMVVKLAKKLKWKRCPHCNFFVEKRDGCLHITCRCGSQFCYGCGKRWSETHDG